MNTSCAQSTFSLQLKVLLEQLAGHNILVKIGKKNDRDGAVPILSAGTARQMVCLSYGKGFSRCGLGIGIYEDTLNLGCNSVELLLSLLALGKGPQERTKSLTVGSST